MSGHRRYHVNEQFFDTFTPRSAYILGYLYGDGYVCKNQGRMERVGIFGALGEEDFLRSMVGEMGNYPVRSNKDCCRTDMTSVVLVSKLKELGYRSRVPELGDNVRHFLRGFLDSDGCVSLASDGRFKVSFRNTTKGLMDSVKALLESRLGVLRNMQVLPSVGNKKESYNLQFAGSTAVPLLRYLMPVSGDLFLPRKWEKARLWLNGR